MTAFPFDIVGFDLDGTLLDSAGDLGEALNHALILEGRTPVPLPQVRQFVGGGARNMLAKALLATGGAVSAERMDQLLDVLLEHYEAHIAVHTRLFDGGLEMLDTLAARGVHIAIVTNKLERFAVKIFAELGLSQRFYTIIGGDTLGAGRAKPRPDLLHLMVERGSLATGKAAADLRVAYVGDTTFDTQAAAAAGIPCVAVAFGFNNVPLEEMGAACVIDHFADLVPALEVLGEAVGAAV